MNMNEAGFRAVFGQFKPFVFIQLVTQMQFMGKTESYELKFTELAKEYNLEIKGLETVEEQMALFDNLSSDDQNQMVMGSIRNFDDDLKEIDVMQDVYRTQDIDSLYQLIHTDTGVIGEQEAEFLGDRNKKWIPQIERMIKQQSTIIAVGAGHLGGPDGVIRLLEKRGYKLTPVKL